MRSARWAARSATCICVISNPLPANLGDVIKRYKQVLVPELNMGQLLWLLRAKYLVDAIGLNKIQGRPFKQAELEQKIEEVLGV